MNNALSTLQALQDISRRMDGISSWNRSQTLIDANGPTGKPMRMYNQTEAVRATGTHTKNIDDICQQLGIDARSNGVWRISQLDVSKIRQHLHGKYKKPASARAPRLCVSTLKGGAGKTTTVTTLATGLATESMEGYKILVIDADPQATSTAFIQPRVDESFISLGDLMMGTISLDEGETFEDACKSAVQATNVPGLFILPAKDTDREYEIHAEQEKMKGGYIAYLDLLKVVEAVESEFDIIIFDTSPQFSTATLAVHYVCDHLLTPLRPTEHDRDAGEKYFRFLTNVYQMLAGMGHAGYKTTKILLAGVSHRQTGRETAHELSSALGPYCMASQIPESEAVTACARQYCTVFDISPHEYTGIGTRKTLADAQERFGALVTEVEKLLLKQVP